jgi:hypothetical protein
VCGNRIPAVCCFGGALKVEGKCLDALVIEGGQDVVVGGGGVGGRRSWWVSREKTELTKERRTAILEPRRGETS